MPDSVINKLCDFRKFPDHNLCSTFEKKKKERKKKEVWTHHGEIILGHKNRYLNFKVQKWQFSQIAGEVIFADKIPSNIALYASSHLSSATCLCLPTSECKKLWKCMATNNVKFKIEEQMIILISVLLSCEVCAHW